jgi:Zn-dependent metalloprotease
MRLVDRRLLIVLAVALSASALAVPAVHAQGKQGKQAWKRFTADNGVYWRVEWSAGGEQAKSLRGRSAPVAGDPATVAETFLAKNADVLALKSDLSDLTVVSRRQSPAGTHLTYQQSHDGLPVFNGVVDVHVSRGGQVYLLHNDTVPAGKLAATQRKSVIPAADAAWLAQNAHFGAQQHDKYGRPSWTQSTRISDGPELGIQKTDAGERLVYRVTVGAIRYLVDAETGDILEAVSLKQSATGTGRIFDPNPVNTLDDGTLQDQGDANFAGLAGAYKEVTLRGIRSTGTGADTRYRLQGPYVRTLDLRASSVGSCMNGQTEVRKPPPVRDDTSFEYNRNQSGFEHTMVYFHIDKNQRYIQSLGFTDLFNRAIRVDAHAFPQDNSFYCGSPSGAGYLAFGDGGVDDAEDADVILHEYGHALQDAASGGRYFGNHDETGAMGEGFGDYWAFSTRPGAPWGTCFADWDSEGACLRKINRNKRYPEDAGQGIHRDGEIWSRGLYDMFRKLGKEKANKIILQSHFLIVNNPKFTNGLTALLDADDELFDGANRQEICSIFLDRGITAPGCGYWILLTWNKVGADVDLHLRPPSGAGNNTWNFGGDCAYYNLNPNWGDAGSADDDPLLYRDCIADCASEQITVDKLTTPGTYRVLVHYYRHRGFGNTTANLEVFRGRRKLFEGSRALSNSNDNPSGGELWFAYNIVVAAGKDEVEGFEVDIVQPAETDRSGASEK